MYWHESGLLGRTKPENLLVANIWKTGDSLETIPGALLCNDTGPLGQAYVLKALTHEVKQ